MVRPILAIGVFGAVVMVSAQQAPPPPPPPLPGGVSQGGRAGGSGVSGGAPVILMEAPREAGTGSISGIVTDGSSGAPVEGALVALTASTSVMGQASATRPQQMTDSKGHFIFTDLPASTSYSLTAARPGFLAGGYRRVPGVASLTRINLIDGQRFADGHIKLWRPAAISGTIRDERGEPLVSIPVRLLIGTTLAGRQRWAVGPSVQTDDRGIYRFAGLTKGQYVVHVPNIQISLPSGEVALYRPPNRGTAGASLSTPAQDALPVLRGADGSGVVTGYFAVPPPDDKGSVYASVYYPASRTLTDADPITVNFSEQRVGVDVQMLPRPSVSVSGVVAGPAAAIAGIPVRIFAAGSELAGLAGDAGVTTADTSGSFTFHRIPEGDYVIVASRSVAEYQVNQFGTREALMPAGGNPFWRRFSNLPGNNGVTLNANQTPGPDVSGRLEVSVGNRAMTGLVVPVIPATTVSGHIEWDGSETPPSGALPFLVRIEPADGDITLSPYVGVPNMPPQGAAATRVTFTLENVKPGHYALADGTVSNTQLALVGATWNGRDMLDTPLEVTGEGPVTGIVLQMTTKVNKVSGTVRSSDGRVANEAAVIVFPAAPAAWGPTSVNAARFRTTTITADGTYELRGMLPGDYLLAAVAMEERNRGNEPAFMKAIAAQATRVTVGPNAVVSQDLRLIGGPR